MRRFPPFTVTLGQTTGQDFPGTPTALQYITVSNYTPYTLELLLAGQTPDVPAESRLGILIDHSWNWDGHIDFTPVADVAFVGSPLSSTVRVHGYGPNERLPQEELVSLVYATGASATTTTLVNEGNPNPTTVIDMGPVGNPAQFTVTNAGNVNNAMGNYTGLAGQISQTAPNNGAVAISALLPSAPVSDQAVLRMQVSGDSAPRSALYVRSADGYGGLRSGPGTSGVTAHLYAQASGWAIAEALTSLGGQATVGNFGLPIFVQEAIDSLDNTASSLVVLSYTPTAGKYRLSGMVQYQTTGSQTVSLSVAYTDRRIGALTKFFSSDAGLLNALPLSASAALSVSPLVIDCGANPVTVTYTCSSTTPNDHVTMFVERLA